MSNTERKVPIAAVGVGSRLTTLLNIMFFNHKNMFELVAIADDNPTALNQAKKRFKIENEYETLEQLLEQHPNVEWVLIGSKNFLHVSQCITAFNKNKNVFCEKPIATTINDCKSIMNAYQNTPPGTRFVTGFVLRHAAPYKLVKKLIAEDDFVGKIVSIEASECITPDHGGYIMRNWRRHKELAGPHILEKCCHDIDLLNWIIDAVPSRVAAFSGNDIFTPDNSSAIADVKDVYEMWDAWENVDPFTCEKSIEDNLTAILQYPNNVRVTFHANSSSNIPQRRMYIMGVKGTIEVELYSGQVRGRQIKAHLAGNKDAVIEENFANVGLHGGGDDDIVADLIRCMQDKNATPKASGIEGLRATVSSLAIDEAAQKRKVFDVTPYWRQFLDENEYQQIYENNNNNHCTIE